MSDTNQNKTNNAQTDDLLEKVELALQRDKQLNEELALKIPKDIDRDYYWGDFFELIKEGFEYNLIKKEEVPNLLKNFRQTPFDYQKQVISNLENLIQKKLKEKDLLDTYLEIKQNEKMLNEIASTLNPSIRSVFYMIYYATEAGIEIPNEVFNQIKSEINGENIQEAQKMKLYQALNPNNRLNLNKRQFNKPLSQKDIENIINSESISPQFSKPKLNSQNSQPPYPSRSNQFKDIRKPTRASVINSQNQAVPGSRFNIDKDY